MDEVKAFLNSRQDMSMYGKWMTISGRSGSITLWNFLCAANAVKSNLEKTSELRKTVRMQEIEIALQEIRSKFPDIKSHRDGLSHASELAKNPKQRETNVAKSFSINGVHSVGNVNFQSCFSGSTFFTTGFGGVIGSYDLNDASLRVLRSVTERIYSAFD